MSPKQEEVDRVCAVLAEVPKNANSMDRSVYEHKARVSSTKFSSIVRHLKGRSDLEPAISDGIARLGFI